MPDTCLLSPNIHTYVYSFPQQHANVHLMPVMERTTLLFVVLSFPVFFRFAGHIPSTPSLFYVYLQKQQTYKTRFGTIDGLNRASQHTAPYTTRRDRVFRTGTVLIRKH